MNRELVWRTLACLCLGAAAAAATIAVILGALASASIPEPAITLDIARIMPARIAGVASHVVPGARTVVVMGDSTVVSYENGRTVVDRLGQTLQAAMTGPVHVDSLASLGMSALEYYPIAGRIADARPDAAVLSFNLQWLSARWRDSLARPEMLALLRPRLLPEAVQEPLHWWNVTLDRLLLYIALWQVGAVDGWRAYRVAQVRTGNGLDAFRARVQSFWQGVPADPKITGMPLLPWSLAPGRPDRLNAQVLRDLYKPALEGAEADHPTLKLLAAILSRFANDGIPIVMYVAPANVEYMRELGILDERGLSATIRTLQAIADAHGAVLLDLHALLPDAGFRDGGGHFTVDDHWDGPLLVAKKIAPVLEDLLSRERISPGAPQ